jgi:hypothetical protein
MRKFFIVLTLAATLLSLLSGCGTEATPTHEGSGIIPKEVLSNFEKKLEPLADDFKLTQRPTEDLKEGKTCLPAAVTDTILDNRYDLLLYGDQTGEAETILLMTERGKHTDISFALLSYYIYKSLNLPEMDADSFYAHFNLLTGEPGGSLSADGWRVSATTTDNFLTFGLTFMPQE